MGLYGQDMGLDPVQMDLMHRLLLARAAQPHPAALPTSPPVPSLPSAGPDPGDPFNPYNGQPGGPPSGVSVDPRFIAQMMQNAAAAMGGGTPHAAPPFMPVVANQVAQPHPALYGLAQALHGALQAYNASGHARQDTGLAAGLNFLNGLGSGITRQGEGVDAQNAANQKLARDTNQLNYLASQEAAKEARAAAGKAAAATPKRSASTLSGANTAFGPGFDPDVIATGLHDGTIPPDPSGFSRGQWGMIATSYRTKYPLDNLTRKTGDWKSLITNIRTMNGSKFQQMGVNLDATDKAIALTRQFSDELSQIAPRYAVMPINKLAQLAQSKFNFGGPEQAAAVQRFVSQANATQLQLASVYMNGAAPTDQAMKHAAEILDYKSAPAAFSASLDVASKDVALRRLAYQSSQMHRGTNEYGDGTVRMRSPSGKVYEFDAKHAANAKAHNWQEVP